jgi:Ca-activated chloride channel family protein
MNSSKLHRSVFILFAILAAALPTLAQTDEIIKVDSRLVVVPVSVIDSAGQPVPGLTAQDFRISEEGKPQQLEQVSDAEKVPLEIALLFDISATTSPMFKFQQETAAKFLKQVMRPEDRATIFTIGQKAILIQSRATAEKSASSVLSIVPTKEQTAFYDSVREAADYLKMNAPAGTRRVVVILSDGEDTSSEGVLKAQWLAERKVTDNVSNLSNDKLREIRVKARDDAKYAEQNVVVRSLQNADTVFYSINPAGSSYQLNKISMFGQENMQKFAVETGGTAYLPHFSPTDLKDGMQNSSNTKKNTAILENIFKRLANELRAQYLVQYYSEAEYPNNKYVKLDVGLQNQTGRQVRARQGYFAKK